MLAVRMLRAPPQIVRELSFKGRFFLPASATLRTRSATRFCLKRAPFSTGARIRRTPDAQWSSHQETIEKLNSQRSAITQRANVNTAVDEKLGIVMSDLPPDERKLAIQGLAYLAAPPSGSAEAENALLTLLESMPSAENNEADLLRAVEHALWDVWHQSGDESVDRLLRDGTDLMERNLVGEAVCLFTSAIEKAPWHAECWNQRAIGRFRLQDYERCAADCKKVLEMKPRHFGCLAGLGVCYQFLQRHSEALECFQAALRVHPSMEAPRRVVRSIEAQQAVTKHLYPHIVRAVRHLSAESDFPSCIFTPALGEEVKCDWDFCEVESKHVAEEDPQTYFIRVRIRNQSRWRLVDARNVARFYVLRFEGGRVFPLLRILGEDAGLVLKPCEEFRFCFYVNVCQKLVAAAGGMLFECAAEQPPIAQDNSHFHVNLTKKTPESATTDEVERWRLGYVEMGRVDLTKLPLEDLL